MPEPSLAELSGGNVDSSIATGNPAVIYDDSQTLKLINENAQFKAQNDWNKYKQFLSDYETRLKNQQEISDKPVSEADREYLKKRSVELFKDVANDPYKIYDPEFNTKLAGLRADATASKTDRNFAEENAKFMMLHPEWSTDENKKMVNDYISGQTLEKGGRKVFTLNLPDQMDYMKYFDTLKAGTESKRIENVLGKGGVMYNREYSKYDKDKFLEKVALSYDSDSRIKRKADKDFNELPPDLKSKFGDAKKYWLQFGSKHFSDSDAAEKLLSEKVAATPNYLDKEKLNLQEREFQHRVANDAASLRLQKDILEFNKTKTTNPANAPSAINYWEQKILPQLIGIKQKKDKKGLFTGDEMVDVPKDFSGDVNTKADQIAGLSVAVFGELDGNDKPVDIAKGTTIKVRYKEGKPVGIVINGQLYDAETVNSKAFQMHDKFVNNKLDISPFIGMGLDEPQVNQPKKVTVKGL